LNQRLKRASMARFFVLGVKHRAPRRGILLKPAFTIP
jgi:hypothetical protein